MKICALNYFVVGVYAKKMMCGVCCNSDSRVTMKSDNNCFGARPHWSEDLAGCNIADFVVAGIEDWAAAGTVDLRLAVGTEEKHLDPGDKYL